MNGLFANTTNTSTGWLDKSAADIMTDVNALLANFRDVPKTTFIVPYHYVYPAPVRFRVTGKRGRNGSAIERERSRQAKGLAVRKSIFDQEWFNGTGR